MKDSTRKVSTAPEGLKNQVFLGIWRSLEHSRNLIEKREEEIGRKRLKEEKVRLGLPETEEILLIGESRDFRAKILLVCSIAVLAVSALGADMFSDAAGFYLLAGGMAGIVLSVCIDRQQKTYLTNYRVLISENSILRRIPKWSCLHYYEIAGTKEKRILLGNELRLFNHLNDKTINIKGISREIADDAAKIISSHLSAESGI